MLKDFLEVIGYTPLMTEDPPDKVFSTIKVHIIDS